MKRLNYKALCRRFLMAQYFTTGQVAKKLRISISTLKRWLEKEELMMIKDYRNYNGWRLFTEEDIEHLKKYKKHVRQSGKNFNDTILVPVNL